MAVAERQGHLIWHEDYDNPPPKARGRAATCETYGQHPDGALKNLPPLWTMRGWIERHDAPIARRQYDTGIFEVPVDPVAQEELRAEVRVEFNRLYGTLSVGVLGKRIEYDGCHIHIYVCASPGMEGQGHVGRYLDSLSRRQTHIFPEVLPDSVMPAMLSRRGFMRSWVADSDDELGIFYPCYTRRSR